MGNPIDWLEKKAKQAKYNLEADAIDGFTGNVRQALESFNQAANQYEQGVNTYGSDWEGEKKQQFLSHQHELNATKFAAHNVAEELIQELRRKAAEYRQKASHVD
ncbi:WXG100 family type VII secretion target [Scopulibacillus cellulosilyticus]|uniref:WXG100 family type VII secretion target n=1 Tax=Scopulibacillus cellulosilyticus TaxID=2665665 RepID=A0ABW2Q1W4_9BACL